MFVNIYLNLNLHKVFKCLIFSIEGNYIINIIHFDMVGMRQAILTLGY